MRLLGRAPAICDVHHGAGKHTLHARHQRVIPLEASETRIEKCRTQRSAGDSRPGASLVTTVDPRGPWTWTGRRPSWRASTAAGPRPWPAGRPSPHGPTAVPTARNSAARTLALAARPLPLGMVGGEAAGVPNAALPQEPADELWEADRAAKPVPPLTDRHAELAIEDASAIRTINVERRTAPGERVIGRKVGLTSKPMHQLLGVDEPDFGVLTDEMLVEDGDLIQLSRLVQPRVEAELAFVMSRDLAGPGISAAVALGAIAGVLPAVEVVDSRVADWKIKLVDTVADNASSGLFVIGGRMRPVADLDLRLLGVAISRNGELLDTFT